MISRYFKVLLMSLIVLSGFTLPAYANAALNPGGIAVVPTTPAIYTDLVNSSTVKFVVTMVRFANYLKQDPTLTAEQKNQINNMKTVIGITYQSDIVNIFSNAIDLSDAAPQNKEKLMANKSAIIRILVDLTSSIASVNQLDTSIQSLLGKLPQLKELGVDPVDLANFVAAVFDKLSPNVLSGDNAFQQLNNAIDAVPSGSSLTKYGISAAELKNAIAGTMSFLNNHGSPEFQNAKNLLKMKFVTFLNQNSTTTSLFDMVDENKDKTIHIDEVVRFLNKPGTKDVNGDGVEDKKDVSLLLELIGPISILH